MSTSGSFSKAIGNSSYKLKVNWSQSKDIANNKSTLTLKAYFINTSSVSIKATSNNFVVDGTSYSFSSSAISSTGTHLLGTKSVTVSHAEDGSKNVSIVLLFKCNATINGKEYSQVSCSANVTLDSIPRASSVSAENTDIGSPMTIKITSAYSGFTHSMTYTWKGTTGTISMDKDTDLSVIWTPPMYLCSNIPDDTSGLCTIICRTYYGSKLIGSDSTTITLRVPSSVKPVITKFNSERIDGDVPSDWGIYIQTKSQISLTIDSASGSYGSTLTSYSITGGGFSSGSSELTTDYLNTSGDITFTAVVTDSRGRQSEPATVTITVYPYHTPRISKHTTSRCSEDGTEDDNGTYAKGFVSYATSSCNGYNEISTKTEYRKISSTDFTDPGIEIPRSTAFIFGGEFSPEYSYEIRYTISDSFTSVTVTDIISTAEVTMDFLAGGKGIAIGKVAEEENCFDISPDWNFKIFNKYINQYILDIIYPVGSVFITTASDISSIKSIGGTWGKCDLGITGINGWKRTK